MNRRCKRPLIMKLPALSFKQVKTNCKQTKPRRHLRVHARREQQIHNVLLLVQAFSIVDLAVGQHLRDERGCESGVSRHRLRQQHDGALSVVIIDLGEPETSPRPTLGTYSLGCWRRACSDRLQRECTCGALVDHRCDRSACKIDCSIAGWPIAAQ